MAIESASSSPDQNFERIDLDKSSDAEFLDDETSRFVILEESSYDGLTPLVGEPQCPILLITNRIAIMERNQSI